MAGVNGKVSVANRQDGIDDLSTADPHSLGEFNEIGYISLDPVEDKRLPVEYFEDELMKQLSVGSEEECG